MGIAGHSICASCWWWDETLHCPDDTRIPNQTHRKACRRYPQIAWRYSTDWCGEHETLHTTADAVTST